jgi:hypothetical protein
VERANVDGGHSRQQTRQSHNLFDGIARVTGSWRARVRAPARARHRAARTPATAQNRVVSAQDRPDEDAAGKQASDTEFPLDA